MRRFVFAIIILVTVRAFSQEFVEVRTPGFTVISDAGEAQAREIAEHFEQVRSAFGIFFNKQSMTLPVPLTFVAFKNSRDFQLFVPRFADKSRAPWPGAVRKGDDENLIAFEISSPSEGRRATSFMTGREFADREYVKLLINGNFPRVPSWYEDGVLEYCAALHVTSKQLIYGVPQADLLTVLKEKPWLRFLQLFGPAPATAEDWDAERHGIFYAQSWITMHYLMSANLGRQLNTFVDLLQNQHVEVQEAIRRAFGVEPKAFENAVRNYLTLGISEYKLNVPPDLAKGPFQVRRLRDADWLATQADLHFRSGGEHDLGMEMFNKAVAADPNSASARRGVGLAYLQRNEFDKARPQLEKALDLDPTSARTHYLLALLDSKSARLGATVDLAAVKQHLQKAIELYPAYADAYQLLSWAESELKNLDAAHTDIEKASELMPRNDFYALTSAQYDLQAKQYDRARPVLERLESSEQPEVARFAHQALANLGPRKADTTASYSTRQQITDPRWQPKEDQPNAAPEKPAPVAAVAPAADPKAKIEFLKGDLVSVDCTKSPLVTITVSAKGKTWVLYSRDVQKLMLIGVENFSCGWTNVKASVNYRLAADGRAEIVSLEID